MRSPCFFEDSVLSDWLKPQRQNREDWVARQRMFRDSELICRPHCRMTSISDELDFDYAAFIAERAVSLMSRLKIAQTAANYFIWFNYCEGTSPGLKRAIDALLENEAHFDASTSAALISTVGYGETAVVLSSDVSKRLGSFDARCAGLSADCRCG